MAFETLLKHKKAFVFGLDDVLYPKKDYLLQVYYLFSEFMAYTEQLDSGAMIAFMQNEYLANGADAVFGKTAAQFGIDDKYRHNFDLLHENARLPLKLLLYKQVLELMQEIVVKNKQIFILADGNPAEEVNKIKQVEWNGLEQYLKVYFTAEFEPKPSSASIDFMGEQNGLAKDDMAIIGANKRDEQFASVLGIEYFDVTKLL